MKVSDLVNNAENESNQIEPTFTLYQAGTAALSVQDGDHQPISHSAALIANRWQFINRHMIGNDAACSCIPCGNVYGLGEGTGRTSLASCHIAVYPLMVDRAIDALANLAALLRATVYHRSHAHKANGITFPPSDGPLA